MKEAILIDGWSKSSRVLALLKKDSSNALVIFISSRTQPQVHEDLTIDKIFPINEDLQCDIGNNK